jgi:HSP20 family protein
MAITKYSVRRPSHAPWADFDTNRLARMFDDSFFSPARSGGWVPAVSVSETNDELTLTAELPGLIEDDISIELENNVLTISGEKADVREEDDADRRYHVVERSYGSFTRSFTLPRTVDGSKIVATFENGVLSVTLPKAAEAKGRRIEISK